MCDYDLAVCKDNFTNLVNAQLWNILYEEIYIVPIKVLFW